MNPIASITVDLSDVLAAAMNPTATVRQEAEAHLATFKETNFPSFLSSLLSALVDDSKPTALRQTAGLLIKNAVDAKEEATRIALQNKWRTVDDSIRSFIRKNLIDSLHSPESDVRRTVALVIAKIALIDLTHKEWPELIPSLLQNMSAQPHVSGTRQATLWALGWLCEEIDPIIFSASDVNLVLTAIVAGMGSTEPDESRLAAFEALGNAIDFAERNFEVEVERDYLMTVVCEGTQANNVNIRRRAFECIHSIASYYYAKLPGYIMKLYELTVKAIMEDVDEVGTQAVEFWSTVAEAELEFEEEGTIEKIHHFIPKAAEHLVPTLLKQLTKQDESSFEDNDSHWDVAMACGVCLNLIAQVVRDPIVSMVSGFIATNIRNEDWRFREASIYVIASILDGPSASALESLVFETVPVIFEVLSQDPHPYVRNTAAYALSRVFAFLHGPNKGLNRPLVVPENLPALLSVLGEKVTKDLPQNSFYVCEAIRYLALGYEDEAESPLAMYMTDLIQKLLEVAARPDANPQNKLATAAYEAINDLIRCSSTTSKDVIPQLITHVLSLLNGVLNTPSTSMEHRQKLLMEQGSLCGMLQVCIQRLSVMDKSSELIAPLAVSIGEALLATLQASVSIGYVFEDAMLCLSAFVDAMGPNFLEYLPRFYPYLIQGLRNPQEWQICSSTIGALGDMCRATGTGILPHCDEIVLVLLEDLSNAQLHRNVKPELLGCFSDIAVAIEGSFVKYLDAVLAVLQKAMETSVAMAGENSQEEDVDYNNSLRNGILNAYVGIVNYVVDDDDIKNLPQGAAATESLVRHLPSLVNFICAIGAEIARGDGNIEDVDREAVGLLADLCRILPSFANQLASYSDRNWLNVLRSAQTSASMHGDSENVVEQSIITICKLTNLRLS
uniref:Importin N-terminal domain-containing protein n=1 Tax=Polytomella parva TaxID=51329 RepID=A0A7S0VBW1_9CHLO|mmetsp:Transcript_35012/g.62961  ORF Transcript_35012/g.62961 Transcript_35012/m.62961 type:complete len:900 (+) Transcript_35012:222-2921(+)|eukprot:CAMPEP_0175064592 /NCGR_PEP_ID=MMETSP0052_2-20121109/15423_1 /TAXON_ID=51329 ORGANISM="Polytomella parva, Strain SAG 63-3" /NCGR_SAMPLE_ID=MMETSP0052_2 /ASSEMBLY_ACC=CAM_ASM_000194 /LENGTH=899 /DNA_ID=CAMNT_0016330969 /DNA_START=201 /DNA_END=2900 /DNA_ORIENTATION=-